MLRSGAKRDQIRVAVDPLLLDSPAAFRNAFLAVAPDQRDAWFDRLLGLDEVPEDGPHLPRGCVPYLPCSVNVLFCAIEQAGVGPEDVFVDVGSGIGRAALFTRLASGASAVGIEVQPELAEAQRELCARLAVTRCSVIIGDAPLVCGAVAQGTVFFLYCPFSGSRLEAVLDQLRAVAHRHPLRLCCVGIELGTRSWLDRLPLSLDDLAVYRSSSAALQGASG